MINNSLFIKNNVNTSYLSDFQKKSERKPYFGNSSSAFTEGVFHVLDGANKQIGSIQTVLGRNNKQWAIIRDLAGAIIGMEAHKNGLQTDMFELLNTGRGNVKRVSKYTKGVLSEEMEGISKQGVMISYSDTRFKLDSDTHLPTPLPEFVEEAKYNDGKIQTRKYSRYTYYDSDHRLETKFVTETDAQGGIIKDEGFHYSHNPKELNPFNASFLEELIDPFGLLTSENDKILGIVETKVK